MPVVGATWELREWCCQAKKGVFWSGLVGWGLLKQQTRTTGQRVQGFNGRRCKNHNVGGVWGSYGARLLVGLKEVLANHQKTQEMKVRLGPGCVKRGTWLEILSGGGRNTWGTPESDQMCPGEETEFEDSGGASLMSLAEVSETFTKLHGARHQEGMRFTLRCSQLWALLGFTFGLADRTGGFQRLYSNYWGIALLSLPWKAYARVLERSLYTMVNIGSSKSNADSFLMIEHWNNSLSLQG